MGKTRFSLRYFHPCATRGPPSLCIKNIIAASGATAALAIGLTPGIHGIENGAQRQSFPRE